MTLNYFCTPGATHETVPIILIPKSKISIFEHSKSVVDAEEFVKLSSIGICC